MFFVFHLEQRTAFPYLLREVRRGLGPAEQISLTDPESEGEEPLTLVYRLNTLRDQPER